MPRLTWLLATLCVAGCSRHHDANPSTAPSAPTEAPAAESEAPLAEVDVAAASTLFASGAATPVDANDPSTREAEGIVPGAVLLTSPSSYALTELPAGDTQLVFYCANEYCSASHQAAERARAAGREVAVMRAGIAGWKEAGQATVPPSS